GGAAVEDPAVGAVVAAEAELHLERRAGVEGGGVGGEAAVAVVGVDALGPAVAELAVEGAAGEGEPGGVDVVALPVRAGRPHQHGGGVGHGAEAGLALAEGGLGPPPLGDVGLDGDVAL